MTLTPAQRRFLLSVDAGPFHARDARSINPRRRALATRLSLAGMINMLPATRRFPVRWVVTGRGSYALGTFASVKA